MPLNYLCLQECWLWPNAIIAQHIYYTAVQYSHNRANVSLKQWVPNIPYTQFFTEGPCLTCILGLGKIVLHEVCVLGTVLWSPTNANSPAYTYISQKTCQWKPYNDFRVSGGPPVHFLVYQLQNCQFGYRVYFWWVKIRFIFGQISSINQMTIFCQILMSYKNYLYPKIHILIQYLRLECQRSSRELIALQQYTLLCNLQC